MIKYVALGVSIGLSGATALWMVAAGYRTDEQGTTMTHAEVILGWGGLLVALLLMTASAIWIGKTGRNRH